MNLKDLIVSLFTAIVGDIRIISNSLTGQNSNADVASILNTTDKTVAGAINEINAAAGSAAVINDAAPSASTTYSGTKIDADIQAGITATVGMAPEALNTLSELSAALGDDEDYAATTTLAIGLKANSADVKTVTQLGADVDTFDYAAAYTTARNAA